MKLASFTILDLLIGMIIGSVVVSIGLSSYVLMQQRMARTRAMNALVEDKSELRNLIFIDGEHADLIYLNGDDLVFENPQRIVRYTSSSHNIVRSIDDSHDTLLLQGELTFIKLTQNSDLIRHIDFIGIDGWHLRYTKQYLAFPLNQLSWQSASLN